MATISRFRVEGLFGHVNHEIHLRPHEPTLLVAPNGAGKTHVLVLLRAATEPAWRELLDTEFEHLEVSFADGRSLRVRRAETEDGTSRVEMSAWFGKVQTGEPITVSTRSLDTNFEDLPPQFIHRADGRWFDRHTGRIMSDETLERRYPSLRWPAKLLNQNESIRDMCMSTRPVFIDTKRLDISASDTGSAVDYRTPKDREFAVTTSRILQYMHQLRREIAEARRSSVQETQTADISFAERALAAAKRRVNEADLHARYDETLKRYAMLSRNSLAIGEAPIEFPGNTTPTVRRILSVFLDDWEKRLAPLLPLNEKIQVLRDILDSKLEPSGKRSAISPRGELEFRSRSGKRIAVGKLSSGEQHLIALFTMLLFSATDGSLVLIDEPEISLHAAWKHAFLDDISRVAAIGNLQVVLATHSSAVINGRWDLTEELHLQVDPEPAMDDPSDDELDDDGAELDG